MAVLLSGCRRGPRRHFDEALRVTRDQARRRGRPKGPHQPADHRLGIVEPRNGRDQAGEVRPQADSYHSGRTNKGHLGRLLDGALKGLGGLDMGRAHTQPEVPSQGAESYQMLDIQGALGLAAESAVAEDR